MKTVTVINWYPTNDIPEEQEAPIVCVDTNAACIYIMNKYPDSCIDYYETGGDVYVDGKYVAVIYNCDVVE